MPPTRLTKDFQCVTGWRVPNTHWTGVKLADLLDRAGVRPGRRRVALHLVRRSVHREPHAGPGAPRRRDRRVRPRRQAAQQRSRRAGSALRRADVRLQVVQVARAGSRSSTTSSRAIGRTRATTSTAGSAAATGATINPRRDADAPAVPPLPALRSRRTRRALVQRDAVPLAPRHRRVAVLRAVVDDRREPAHREDDPRVCGSVAPAARCCSASCFPRVGSCGATPRRINRWTVDDRRWWSRSQPRDRAARQVQSGSEAQRDLRRRRDRVDVGYGVDHALVRAVPRQHPRPARPSCTTGSSSHCSS